MKVYVLVVMVGLMGCSRIRGVQGSGKAKTEVRAAAGFSKIEASGSLDVEITVAAEPRVEVSGDDNLVAMVETRVSGDGLTIVNHGNVNPVVPLVVRVAVPRIAAVTASGATTVALHGVHDDQISITVGGAATLHGDGAVHQLTVDTSGAGTLDLARLTAERAGVKASGAGTVVVDVTQALDVRVSGAGTVTYHGNPPDVKQDVSTAGTLTKG